MADKPAAEEILDPQMMRTLLANDRTYLAWRRTALGFVVVIAGAVDSRTR